MCIEYVAMDITAWQTYVLALDELETEIKNGKFKTTHQ
jgi:hypothetical protein